METSILQSFYHVALSIVLFFTKSVVKIVNICIDILVMEKWTFQRVISSLLWDFKEVL